MTTSRGNLAVLSRDPEFTAKPSPAAGEIAEAIARLKFALERLEVESAPADAQGGAPDEAPPGDELPSRVAGRADALMDWLRADLSARYFGQGPVPEVEIAPMVDDAVPAADAGRKDRYTVAELMGFTGDAFVRNAYRALLQRDPDVGGLAHYRECLREGTLTRIEVLGALRFSGEGRGIGVRVPGLGLAFLRRRLGRLVTGRLLAGYQRLLRVRALARGARSTAEIVQGMRQFDADDRAARERIEALTARLVALQASERALRRWVGAFGERLVSLDRKVLKLEECDTSREELLEIARPLAEAMGAIGRFHSELDESHRRLEAESLGRLHRMYEDTASWMDTVSAALEGWRTGERAREAAVQRLGQSLDEVRQQLAKARVRIDERALDAFYAEFEDRFRGTRADIKARVAVYLPVIEAARGAAEGAPVVDIGCGRGEWLELLGEKSIQATGVDSNAVMVQACRERGLEVVESDAVDYLVAREANSAAAITGFHVIEHLSLTDMIALFDQSLRVLKPGGAIVFETPNPENLIVGACSFWLDLTHVRPLPPEIIRHVVEVRGFTRAEIRRLHPAGEWLRLPQGADAELSTRLNALLYGEQDYSIIAYKP
jgi:O-antigen chain-terminating methyltransferase